MKYIALILLAACQPVPINVRPQAEAYLYQLGLEPQGLVCQQTDGNGGEGSADGYVSCTATFSDREPMAFECSYNPPNGIACNDRPVGCRISTDRD